MSPHAYPIGQRELHKLPSTVLTLMSVRPCFGVVCRALDAQRGSSRPGGLLLGTAWS